MLTIIKKDHPVLRQTAREVEHGEDVGELINGMRHAMFQGRGIGLAANQVGVLKRVILIHSEGLKLEIINPIITKYFGGKKSKREGCLSHPSQFVMKVRYAKVIIEGFDVNWKPVKKKLKNLSAACAQHEIDHLNGINIVD